MAYKVLKVVTIGDKTFNPGEIIDIEVESRFIKSKKVELIEENISENISEDVKPKQNKQPKNKVKEEILIDNSSDISVTEIKENNSEVTTEGI